MAKKENVDKNYAAAKAKKARNHEANQHVAYKLSQKKWRLACLAVRKAEGRLTEKNLAELTRLEG
jgi:hypothetical protein